GGRGGPPGAPGRVGVAPRRAAGADPPRLPAHDRPRRERRHRQRPPTAGAGRGPEEPGRGVRADRVRGELEGAPGHREPGGRPPGEGLVLLTLFLTCFVAVGISTVLLVALGRRLRIAGRALGVALGAAVAIAAGELARVAWHLQAGSVRAAQVLVFLVIAAVSLLRPPWNAVGHVFFGSFVAAAGTYLGFAAWFRLFGGLSVVGALASGVLFLFELVALFLAGSFAFE